MRYSTLDLWSLAVLSNIVLTVVSSQQPHVVAGNLQERANQPSNDDDWPIVEEDYGHGGHHGHHGNNGNWPNGPENYRKCPRQFPLSQKGPFQVLFEFNQSYIVPNLLAQGPSHYAEVRTKAEL